MNRFRLNLALINNLRLFCTFPSTCWKCGSARTQNLFCANCNAIQKPEQSANYFEVFDLKTGYDVDLKGLTRRYREMQSVLHPDKFSTKSDEEKLLSEEYSSLVNKAYDNLQTPLKRALHLLELNGETIGEDDKSVDGGFLAEIMELNEAVEDAESDSDFRELDARNRSVLARLALEISECFRLGDVRKAKESVIRMKYYSSLSARINAIMREKGIID